MTQVAKQLGAAIRERRKLLGLSQLQTCELAEVSPSFLYALEQGKPTARMNKVFAVLEVLGLELELREGHGLFHVNRSCGGQG